MRLGLEGQGNKHHYRIQKAFSAISKVNIPKPSYQASVESGKHLIFSSAKRTISILLTSSFYVTSP